MKLIVGLGNPGAAYARNRHNGGFMCLDYLARLHGIPWSNRTLYKWGQGQLEGVEVVLAKPRTYMNLSGQAVAALARSYRLKAASVLIIHDDLDLSLGSLRFKLGGSAAGHKGVESVIEALGSRDFPRLRVGIGRPQGVEGLGPEAKAEATAAYVLSNFGPQEEPVIQEAVARAAEAVASFLFQGLATAMGRFN